MRKYYLSDYEKFPSCHPDAVGYYSHSTDRRTKAKIRFAKLRLHL